MLLGKTAHISELFFLWAYRSWRGSCHASHDLGLCMGDININIEIESQISWTEVSQVSNYFRLYNSSADKHFDSIRFS